jgi:ATP-dependent DNA helicase RecQ
MCDNCRYPPEHYDATAEAKMAIDVVHETGGKFGMNYLINVLRGSTGQQIKELGHDKLKSWGVAKAIDEKIWKAVFSQLIVRDYLTKDIADYGVIRLGKEGEAFIQSPHKVELVRFRNFEKAEKEAAEFRPENFKGYDEVLYDKLLALRKEIARKNNLPPYIIFQETSLEEIATKYPITLAEFENITGVGKGKAAKYAEPFVRLVREYVEENDITRTVEVVVRTQGKNINEKRDIITQIDRKTALEDIAERQNITIDELLDKIDQIIYSGLKLNIAYCVEQMVDADKEDEIYNYFRNAESDCIDKAQVALGSDFTREEIRVVRARFYSELAN